MELRLLTGCCLAATFGITATVDAGIVTVTQDMAGVLQIVGSNEDDRILVSGNRLRVTVTALGITRFPAMGFRGSRLLTFESATGINFQGLDGHDSLTANLPLDTLVFDGGNQDDYVAADIGPATSVTITGGEGQDRVILTADGAESISVDLGDGNDEFSINDSAVGALTVTDGGGNDKILLNGVTGLTDLGIVLSIDCGDGDDQLVFAACSLRSVDPMATSVFNGGVDDNDQIGQVASFFDPAPTIDEFEIVIGFMPPPPPPPAASR